MHPSSLPPRCFFFFLFLFFLCCSTHGRSGAGAQTSSPDELSVLLDLKAALAATSPASVFQSWHTNNSICNFSGVQCAAGHVTTVDLYSRNLSGNLPFDSICRLPSLVKLRLGENTLSSGDITALTDCVNLEFLDLAGNVFSGEVPNLSSLKKLQELDLSDNAFTGQFPWASLQSLPELHTLRLGDNPFNRTPSFPSVVVRLSKLRSLYLSNCSIYGQIPPSIGNLTGLVNLELSDNLLHGEIPPEIAKLSALVQLEVYDNVLTGSLPAGFGNLSSLNFLDASGNLLEGNLTEIKRLTKLISLQLFENNFSGELPAELGDFRDLVNLSLYSNRLAGQLPRALGSWAAFDFIDVSTNQLTGPIPPDMCKKGAMRRLLMLENRFTGSIPATYANCTSLIRFRLSNNSLSGEVPPGIWSLPNLTIIDLSINHFSGIIDPGVGMAKALSQICVSFNQFSGELPPEISGATSLVMIDAGHNRLSGAIPASMGDLKRISVIYLQRNMLSGIIPNTLGSCPSLTQINLAENFLSGEIPPSLGRLPDLNALNLSTNLLFGKIPWTFSSLKLSSLDLSSNRLSGEVPPQLALEVFRNSFEGNPALCGYRIPFLHSCSSFSARASSLRLWVLLSCILVAVALVIAISFCLLVRRRRQSREDGRLVSKDQYWSMQSFRVVSFDEQEILSAIRQENLVGNGGSGNVYRVSLSNGKTVAVKHIWNCLDGGSGVSAAMLSRRPSMASREFQAEATTLSAISHVNVVKLFCTITSEDSNLLVYEYLPNGSLWDRLHSAGRGKKLGAGLGWDTRYEVALGAARGLEYLHHGCDRPVVHRDVKSSNILLDEYFKPRIADFGLAKILQAGSMTAWRDASSTTCVVAGTHGYIAPEYAYTAKVNEKSDVYSFGVVLMELATGKRPNEPEFGENKDIVQWVYGKMLTGEVPPVAELLDPCIPEGKQEAAVRVLRIGVRCTMRLPGLRPSMRAVVQMLEEAGQEQLPAPSAVSGISTSNQDGRRGHTPPH